MNSKLSIWFGLLNLIFINKGYAGGYVLDRKIYGKYFIDISNTYDKKIKKEVWTLLYERRRVGHTVRFIDIYRLPIDLDSTNSGNWTLGQWPQKLDCIDSAYICYIKEFKDSVYVFFNHQRALEITIHLNKKGKVTEIDGKEYSKENPKEHKEYYKLDKTKHYKIGVSSDFD